MGTLKNLMLSSVSIVCGIILWELLTLIIPGFILAPPSKVFVTFVKLIWSGELPMAVLGSIKHFLAGYILSAFCGIGLGFFIGRSEIAYTALNPIITAFYSIPGLAFVPFIIIWFDFFMAGRIAVVFLLSFFEILLTTYSGVNEINPQLIEVANSFRAGKIDLYKKIILPASLPYIFAALRLGSGRAVRGMIAGELFLHNVYLGSILMEGKNSFDTALQLSVIVTLSILGLLIQGSIQRIERRVLHWRQEK